MELNCHKITQKMCIENTLIFRPIDKNQAVNIQTDLFRLGVRWAGHTGFDYGNAARCAKEGMVVSIAEIYTGSEPVPDKSRPPLYCTAKQLRDDYNPADDNVSEEDLKAAQAIFDNLQVGPHPLQSPAKPQKSLTEEMNAAAQQDDDEDYLKPIHREKRPVNEELLKEALKELDDAIGLDQVSHNVRQVVALIRMNVLKEKMGVSNGKTPSRHLVFTGPPGTGKTMVAGIMAKIFYALGITDRPEAIDVSREDFVGEHIGVTERKTKDLIKKARGGILFIDEAYSLTADDSKRDFGIKAVNILNRAMENLRDDLIVIVAGYPKPMEAFLESNEGFASRFRIYVPFDSYSMDDLGQIMDLMLKQSGCSMTPEARTEAIKKLEKDKDEKESKGDSFGNARIVRNLIEGLDEAHALHMFDEGELDDEHDWTDEAACLKALTTYTVADVKDVSLKGIKTEQTTASSSNARMGFAPAGTPVKRMSLVT